MRINRFTKSYFQTQGNRQYFSKNHFPSWSLSPTLQKGTWPLLCSLWHSLTHSSNLATCGWSPFRSQITHHDIQGWTPHLLTWAMKDTSFGVSEITFKGKRSQIVYIWQVSSGGHIWGLLNEHRETEAGRHQSAAAQALTSLEWCFSREWIVLVHFHVLTHISVSSFRGKGLSERTDIRICSCRVLVVIDYFIDWNYCLKH